MTAYIKEIRSSDNNNNSKDNSPITTWRAVAERLVFVLPPNPETTPMTIRIHPHDGDIIPAISNTTIFLNSRHDITVIVDGVSPGGR